MTELWLTFVLDLDDALLPAEQHVEEVREQFLRAVQDDNVLVEMALDEIGVNAIGDEKVAIQATIDTYNGVDYINDEMNRDGLLFDFEHALEKGVGSTFLSWCEVTASLLPAMPAPPEFYESTGERRVA